MPEEAIYKENLSFFKKISPPVRILIFSDILLVMSRLGLIAPVFAVYITQRITNGNLEVVGIATTIYLLTKSLMQLPASALIDKIKGEKDDFMAMFLGTFVYCLVPLLYIVIKTPIELYLVQFILGLASACVFPSWSAIFTRHMDKEREAMEWGAYFTFTDLSSAVAATMAGFIALKYGFTPLFIIASIISFFGLLVLFSIKKEMRKT